LFSLNSIGLTDFYTTVTADSRYSISNQGPTWLIKKVKKTDWYKYKGDYTKCGTWLILIAIGLILNPFFWLGLLIYWIPKGITYMVRQYRQRRQIEEVSMQSLRDRLI
jgi:hypothetical protein